MSDQPDINADTGVPKLHPPARVLIIDDSPLNRRFAASTFESEEYEVLCAESGEEGYQIAAEKKPEVILLDIMMPEENGYECCEKLKNDTETHGIPIIFITALDSIKDKLRAFEAGGVDYVTKPFNHNELVARVKTHIRLLRTARENDRLAHIAMEEKQSAVIGRIAAGVSHNFSNLLGASLGNMMLTETLLGDDIDPMAKEALEDLKTSLERQRVLLQQFLHLTDRGMMLDRNVPKPAEIDLGRLMDEIVENLRLQKHGSMDEVTYQNQVGEEVLFVCDPDHAREIFHLIFNEIIKVSTGETLAEISSEKHNHEEISCRLKFTGLEIDQSYEDSIFEPFALPLANVGTGLSFAVAKHLIKINQGEITAVFPGKNQFQLELNFHSA